MKLHRLLSAAGLVAALPLVWAVPASASSKKDVQIPAATVITVTSKHSEMKPDIQPENVQIKVNGKMVQTRQVIPLRGPRAGLELVILIDSGARTSLGRQLSDIASFIKSLPPTTEVGVAYMVNGQARFEQPFTADKELATHALHMPGGIVGSSASPYFCIQNLANNWPSRNAYNRRQVIVITDGIDPYEVRFDPDDPYVRAAIHAAIRAGVTVDAIYWHDAGLASHIGWIASGGQNLLTQITNDTGGQLYYEGLGNPVSFKPFLDEINNQLDNQYELSFMVPAGSKSQIANLSIKLHVPDVKSQTPHLLYIPGVKLK